MLFSFTAGIISFFSPCAFPMLPAYLSYYLGINKLDLENDTNKNRIIHILKDGLIGGLVCATGAITVFIFFGIFVSFFGNTVKNIVRDQIISMNLIVGLFLIILGVIMFSQLNFNQIFKIKKAPKIKGYTGLFLYGILYSLVAAGCVAPLFVGVITRAFITNSFLEGLLVFLSYSFGLAIFLIISTLLIASAKEAIIKKMNRLVPYIQRAGSVILIVVGIWLIYYWYLITYTY
jgi:cytochrome c-type biogenesis protein